MDVTELPPWPYRPFSTKQHLCHDCAPRSALMSFKLIWSNVADPRTERRSVGPYCGGMTPDETAIGELVATFFAAFTSGPGLDERMDALRAALLPEAVIVKTCGAPPGDDVDGFLEPRRALLAGGTLTGFREWAEPGRTEVYGDI